MVIEVKTADGTEYCGVPCRANGFPIGSCVSQFKADYSTLRSTAIKELNKMKRKGRSVRLLPDGHEFMTYEVVRDQSVEIDLTNSSFRLM